jgi:hypothetical protein
MGLTGLPIFPQFKSPHLAPIHCRRMVPRQILVMAYGLQRLRPYGYLIILQSQDTHWNQSAQNIFLWNLIFAQSWQTLSFCNIRWMVLDFLFGGALMLQTKEVKL